MTNALLLFKMDQWVTDDMKARLQGTSLANAKQLICGTMRDEILVDLAATTLNDVNLAVTRLAEVKGVKSVTVMRVGPDSP
jgi:hypothetical protein